MTFITENRCGFGVTLNRMFVQFCQAKALMIFQRRPTDGVTFALAHCTVIQCLKDFLHKGP